MPERNFEQQARDMANGFEKEPTPEVWQNVRTAIQPPQRKRRFALWWWLLPLALAGGVVAFYTFNKTSNKLPVVKSNQKGQKSGAKTAPSNKEQQADSKLEIMQEENKATTSLPNNNATTSLPGNKTTTLLLKNNAAHQNQITAAEKVSIRYNRQAANGKAAESYAATANSSKDLLASTYNKPKQDSSLSAPVFTNKNSRINDSDVALKNKTALLVKDRLNDTVTSKDAAVAKAVLQPDSAKNKVVKKKNKHAALQWGLIAEAGVAARKSSVFSALAGSDKSMDMRTVPQNYIAANSSFFGLTNNSGFSFSNNIKHGAALSLGVALQNKLNRSTDVFTNVTYDYQSYKLTSMAYKDSLLLNYSFTTSIGSYEATQSFNFASVFAGINWHFVNTRKLQFGISAGADNLLLITARQKINSVSNSSLSVNRMQGLSDSTFSKNNFYKYQPSLFAGILINVKWNNRQLQLVPFARTGFRPFGKNATSTNNHLFSAGLRAVYFFKQ